MVLPWLVAVAAEYVVFRRFFRHDLDAGATDEEHGEPRTLPLFALVTVVCTLAGFVVASAFGVDPAWSAAGRGAGAGRARTAPAPSHPAGGGARGGAVLPGVRAGTGRRGARGRRQRSDQRARAGDPRRHRPAR